jgi:hypothetical protein
MRHCKIIYCRLTIFNGVLQDLNVFVWELEPLDGQTRTVREWAEDCIREDCLDLLPTLGIKEEGGWEAVFSATVSAPKPDPWWPNETAKIVLRDWQTQELPSEMFDEA